MKQNKGKLDIITFFYGFGAAVVLLGSMFKFLDWNYANELFIIGLSVEVLVFLISAFERTTDDKEYEWEKVFPQLQGSEGKQADLSAYQDAMTQFGKTVGELATQIQHLNQSLQQVKTEMEANASAGKEMHEKMKGFNEQLGEYNGHMQQVNARYKEFLSQRN